MVATLFSQESVVYTYQRHQRPAGRGRPFWPVIFGYSFVSGVRISGFDAIDKADDLFRVRAFATFLNPTRRPVCAIVTYGSDSSYILPGF